MQDWRKEQCVKATWSLNSKSAKRIRTCSYYTSIQEPDTERMYNSTAPYQPCKIQQDINSSMHIQSSRNTTQNARVSQMPPISQIEIPHKPCQRRQVSLFLPTTHPDSTDSLPVLLFPVFHNDMIIRPALPVMRFFLSDALQSHMHVVVVGFVALLADEKSSAHR